MLLLLLPLLLLLAAGPATAASPVAPFAVPPLNYSADALAPAVPADTLDLHYGVHPKGRGGRGEGAGLKRGGGQTHSTQHL